MKTNIAAVLLLALSACGGAATSAPATATPATVSAAAPVAVKKDIVDLLPPDASAVIRLDLRRLASASLWKRYGGAALGHPKVIAVQSMLDDCDLDLTRDVTELAFAWPAEVRDRDNDIAVALRGRFDADRFARCASALYEGLVGGKLVVHQSAGVTELVEPSGARAYFAWPAADTVVFTVASTKGDASALAWVGTLARQPPGHPALRAQLDADPLLSGFASFEGALRDQYSEPSLPVPDGAWLNLTQTHGLGFEVGMRYADEAQALTMDAALRDGLRKFAADPTKAPYLAGARVDRKGGDVVLSVDVDAPHLDELAAKVADLMPFILMGIAGADEPAGPLP